MKYTVMKTNLRTGNEVKHADYTVERNAINAVEELNNDNPSRRAKVLYIPENIGEGYKIYLTDGEYYGTILYETEYFYYVSKDKEAPLIECDFFNKETFQDKFDEGHFKPIDGEQ